MSLSHKSLLGCTEVLHFPGPTLHHSLCHQEGLPPDLPRLVSHPARSYTSLWSGLPVLLQHLLERQNSGTFVQVQPITPVVLGELDTDGPKPHSPWLDSPGDSARAGAHRAKHAIAFPKHRRGLRGFARFASVL